MTCNHLAHCTVIVACSRKDIATVVEIIFDYVTCLHVNYWGITVLVFWTLANNRDCHSLDGDVVNKFGVFAQDKNCLVNSSRSFCLSYPRVCTVVVTIFRKLPCMEAPKWEQDKWGNWPGCDFMGIPCFHESQIWTRNARFERGIPDFMENFNTFAT